MARDERVAWEKRWAGKVPGAAAPFLVEHAALLPIGRTLDLACGAGRNACFLAGLGHRVVAVDFAITALAGLRGIERVHPVRMDLDEPGIRYDALDAVVVVDFLDRRLFDHIPRWLRLGGVVVFDTFLADRAAVGHPRNPQFLLRRNELRERFSKLRLLRFREGECGGDGERSYRSGIVSVRER